MGKSRHQRHIRTMRKLWVSGFSVVMVRTLDEPLGKVYVGMRATFVPTNLLADPCNRSLARRLYFTPPSKGCSRLLFIVSDDNNKARMIYGWKALADFAACGGFTREEEEE